MIPLLLISNRQSGRGPNVVGINGVESMGSLRALGSEHIAPIGAARLNSHRERGRYRAWPLPVLRCRTHNGHSHNEEGKGSEVGTLRAMVRSRLGLTRRRLLAAPKAVHLLAPPR